MPFSVELQKHLFGRALLLVELPFDMEIITQHLEAGYVQTISGIENGRCGRCSNEDDTLFAKFPCYRCGHDCTYCRHCIMMGRVSTCTDLYIWTGPSLTWEASRCHWVGQLSLQQQEASDKIAAAVQENKECLLWAVTGAGKTETVFRGIALALGEGKRVALACPRVDVILELAPRIEAAFPKATMAVLHGTSEDRNFSAQLVLATTHQLFRYREAFDVIIVDEVDAFPFSADRSLQLAVTKAAKSESAIIFLTATPTPKWQQELFQDKRNGILIPARFHRHPNPEPTTKWIGNWRKAFSSGKIPKVLQRFLAEQKQPFLLFFPHIALMVQALPLIRQIAPDVLSVHAEDPERKEKVMQLRNGQIQGLLTTTILERGITIKGLDVAVIGAEDRTFTEAALVQIAGRVGRDPAQPFGKVIFFHHGKTREMVTAIRHIQKNNRLAKQRGLLD